jgi:hypothetical protein
MGKIVGGLFGSKPKAGVPMAGAQFQPYSYKSLTGTSTGTRQGDGYNFSQELSPELQELYRYGQAQSQPFLSQYLNQAQAPVAGFDFNADPRAREAEIFQQQQALLQPTLLQQQTQMQNNLFGSGRLGLQLSGDAAGAGAGIGMVNPDAYGLGLAQSRAIAELGPQARRMAQAEQEQAFGQAELSYRLNQAAQQQQLQNLLGGYQSAFGAVGGIRGLEQGLTGQAAGLEEARAKAMAGSSAAGTQPTAGSGGLFGALATGVGMAVGGPMGAAIGSSIGGAFSKGGGGAQISPINYNQSVTPNLSNYYSGGTPMFNNSYPGGI